MPIFYDDKTQVFHLQSGHMSYIFEVLKDKYLAHIYWGKKINNVNHLSDVLVLKNRAFSANGDPSDKSYTLDNVPQEYPSYGNVDVRNPAYQIQLENGSTITDLKYAGHRIEKGKRALEGLPATYVESEDEASTLEVKLEDNVIGLKAYLSYTVYETLNVITRSVRFENKGEQTLKILKALSMSIDFPDCDYDLLHLYGAWARERHISRTKLMHGIQGIDSKRGASSHQHNPFMALLSNDATEDYGEVYGFNLVYSGNFSAVAEVDQLNTTRVSIGINPFDFSWLLMPGESFQTPEVVMVYSANGLGEMSRTYHTLYRTRLCRGKYRDAERPVLVNNWEATYFNFNEEKILNIARSAKELGIELFVLDDGWFGKRDSDNCSLGDWVVDTHKLPNGLGRLAAGIEELGLKFGLWFEPEMVSPDSDLYRAHQDWCIHVPDRTRSESRNQLILDLSREDVCDYIVAAVSNILRSAPISYVKWDMNRHMSEIGSAALPPERQRETAYRYMLGLYKVMDKITTAFPDILFESCSGGGGRFDPGILYYMPQTWTSDDTDAVERLYIQYGTSIVYPVSSMGSHVSAVPNHQLGRVTSLKMRGDVALSGNFGYELDLSKFTPEEKELAAEQIRQCKEIRKVTQFGQFYRLKNPFDGNDAAWQFISEDENEIIACYFNILAKPNAPLKRLRLKGLDEKASYRELSSSQVFGGDLLMNIGINLPDQHGDFQSVVYRFERVSER